MAYPAAVPSVETVPSGTYQDDATYPHRAAHNTLSQDVHDIATTLGVTPATVDETVTPVATPTTVVSRLDMAAAQLKAILGAAHWYSSIPISLTTLLGKFDGTTGHTHDGTAGNGPTVSGGGGGGGMTNPMTTQDDLIIGGASGAPARLAKGTDGQVLTVNPSTHHLDWATPSGGGGGGSAPLGDPTGLFTSWDNQDTATVDESLGDVLLTAPASGTGTPHCRVKSAPGSTPWNADFAFYVDINPTISSGWVAVGFRKSSDGKLVLASFQNTSGNAPTLRLDNWNTATSYNAGVDNINYLVNFALPSGLLFLRLQDDGTNLIAYYSLTAGRTWHEAFREARSLFIGTPDQIVIAVRDGTTIDNSMLLKGYAES